jgi:hypothetical protein
MNARPLSIGAPTRWRSLTALVCLAFSLIALLALHVLRPGLDPATHAVSDYARGEYGWLATEALVALGAGALAVASALRENRVGGRTSLLVAIFGAGILVAAAFPVSAPGQPEGFSEHVHGAAAFVAFPALSVAMLASAGPFARNGQLRPLAGPTGVGGLFALLTFFLGNVVVPDARGTVERVYLAVLILWLLAVALRLAVAAPGRGGPSPPAV